MCRLALEYGRWSQRAAMLLIATFGIGIAGLLAPAASSAETTLPPGAQENTTLYQWPQWRGPLMTGVAPHSDPPVEWSETKNIRWKVALPGKGHSTPAVWGDRVFVTAAAPVGEASPAHYSGAPGAHDETPITHRQKFMVIALDRRDGKTLWERTVREEVPHQGGHVTASLASSSPITDGERIYAHFGSWGLYCLDLKGEILWQKNFGHLDSLHGHGEGSSPVLHGATLIVNWDHEGDSFVLALDKHSGRELWRTPREPASSWSSPIVVEHDGKAQVIVSGSKWLRAYDLADGKLIWECGGLSAENVVASPVAGHGMVFAGSTYDQPGVFAIRLEGARGDITESENVVWRRRRGAPYVPSPLLYGDALMFLNHFQGGIITRVNARTGADQPGAFRVPGMHNIFASPVAAAGRVYITSREGATAVLKDGDPLELLAQNRLDDQFSASPALVGNSIFLRGEKYLYCLAESGAEHGEHAGGK
ncbi:outer membrane protein assembly factor BamB family protein [Verrucomicrobiota bacterium sgz303538]